MALADGLSSRLRRVAKRVRLSCASFSSEICLGEANKDIPPSENANEQPDDREEQQGGNSSSAKHQDQPNHPQSVLCAICLEPLACAGGAGGDDDIGTVGQGQQPLFTAQCSHSFHMLCISSNVRHGSVTCPICRAHWTQLPRDLTAAARLMGMAPPCAAAHADDPILRILDDSIANFRVNRRSSLRTARYDDDDPVDADQLAMPQQQQPRLLMSLVSVPMIVATGHHHHHLHQHHQDIPLPSAAQLQGYEEPGGGGVYPNMHHLPPLHHPLLPHPLPLCHLLQPQHLRSSPDPVITPTRTTDTALCLSIRLSHQQPTDVILVASPNGPHLRLLKQSLSLVAFSLRPADRLSIVTYSSSSATRALPLRRMTTSGKRAALQVIDRLFYLGDADPLEGLKKAIKILDDRTHRNPLCCILHLSDNPPTRAYVSRDLQVPVPIHWFHVGFGFSGAGGGFVMHEFEEFLLRLLGGVVRDAQIRIRRHREHEYGPVVGLAELRGGEERRILLEFGCGDDDCEYVCVAYSYVEGGLEECLRTGEVVVGVNKATSTSSSSGSRDFSEISPSSEDGRRPEAIRRVDFTGITRRRSAVERYLDPFMARRWAKHLNGYRA